ncbi:MAG: c-type cytochrome [Deltaproteobacteria bacterium]|nr:c-type cytochrome [Deltaproteobacteria bacterium]
MSTWMTAVGIAVISLCLALSGYAAEAKKGEAKKATKGEELFKQHCAMCHPDGGNIINAKKTLHAKDLKANKITKAEDIVRVMRNPGPGMNKFDEKTIPDKEAKEIAQYIRKTFK